MRLYVNDALNGDLIRLPFLDEIANAGANSLEGAGLLDALWDGNDAVVQGLGGGVIAFKDGIPGVPDGRINSKSAHNSKGAGLQLEPDLAAATLAASAARFFDRLTLLRVEQSGVLVVEPFQLFALDLLVNESFDRVGEFKLVGG